MLILRLSRQGKKRDYIFRVVATDSRKSSRSGKVRETLGWWNPRNDKFQLNTERIQYWLKQGAQTSDSVFNLLVTANIISAPKRKVVVHSKKKAEGKKEEIKIIENSPEAKISTEEATGS